MSALETIDVSLKLPPTIFSALREDPVNFVEEMRLAAAVKWYEIHRISQGKAAEIAGLSRSEFLIKLAHFDVSPFQYDADEIVSEVFSD